MESNAITIEKKESEINFLETKSFLMAGISDLSGWIKFSDTKVSIIMTAMGVIASAVITCRKDLRYIYSSVELYSCTQVMLVFVSCVWCICLGMVYWFGIQTLKQHRCKIDYNTHWFISKTLTEYSYENYKQEIEEMTKKDIVDELAAELYKLNDINRQKSMATKYTLYSFAAALICMMIILLIVLHVVI